MKMAVKFGGNENAYIPFAKDRSNTSDGGSEARSYSHGTGRGQHLRVPRLVLEDALEGADHFAQQLRHDTGDVHKGTLGEKRGT